MERRKFSQKSSKKCNSIPISSISQIPMNQLPINAVHPSSPPKDDIGNISSKREFNWTKIRKLSGWMYQTTNSIQQKVTLIQIF